MHGAPYLVKRLVRWSLRAYRSSGCLRYSKWLPGCPAGVRPWKGSEADWPLSRVKGNFHPRFLGGAGGFTACAYRSQRYDQVLEMRWHGDCKRKNPEVL